MKAKTLKAQVLTLYFVAQDQKLPLALKIFVVVVVAYALSPIDLIPDFIPVLGLLDDLIIVPLGVWLILKLTPVAILADAQEKAKGITVWPVNYLVGAIFIGLWFVIFVALICWVWPWFCAIGLK